MLVLCRQYLRINVFKLNKWSENVINKNVFGQKVTGREKVLRNILKIFNFSIEKIILPTEKFS